MVDQQGQGWLVDFDRAEAAATDQLLDRDLTTLLAALDVADPALVHATAEQALGLDTMARVLPLAAATPAPPATPPKDPNRPGSPSDPPNTSLTSRLQTSLPQHFWVDRRAPPGGGHPPSAGSPTARSHVTAAGPQPHRP